MADDLFSHASRHHEALFQPLAERMRPRCLDDVIGQQHLLGPGKPLRVLLDRKHIPSMVFWGPAGCGKTTLARLMAQHTHAVFESMSAVESGLKEVRAVIEKARERRHYQQQKTLLFLDEIHRFNKTQQDALLPHVESGVLILVGATTENPSFELTHALLSRCRVWVLNPLQAQDIARVLQRAQREVYPHLAMHENVLLGLAQAVCGDARKALTCLDIATQLADAEHSAEVTSIHMEHALGHKTLRYDKQGEEHYNIISAFIKSLRGSDADAAVYWMARMLEAGEAPRFVLRRMVIFASEDIGNADPHALQVAMAALQAFDFVGMPEGVLPMTQAATYLACAPKSNSVITAYTKAHKDVTTHGSLDVPKKLRNAPTSLMKSLGYGKDYKYPHHFENHYVVERYLPDELHHARYYIPSNQGYEARIQQRLMLWQQQHTQETHHEHSKIK